MSDDLMKLLRRQYGNLTGGERHAVADRIEALEAQLAKATEVVEASGRKRGELEAKLAKAVEALEQCAEAFELHSSAYPAMVKGYTLDALTNASATIAAIKGEE